MKARLWLAFLTVTLSCVFSPQLSAQTWPDRPVRLIVGFAAGGPTDVVARMLADKYGTMWGKSVIVENRPGAGGSIASAQVANAPPDGYTLYVVASSHTYNDALLGNLPFDPVKDFTPISRLITYSNVLLTHNSVKANNLKELVAFAKANPGMLSFATAGSGSGAHLAAELFKRAAGIDITVVHYKGAAPATNDLFSGHVQAMFNNPLSAAPLLTSGKVRALATTGGKRSPTMADVPTVAESGYPGFDTSTWFGVIGPAGLHRDIVSKVSRDTGIIIAMDDVRTSLMKMGLEPASSTPEEFAQILRDDNRTYGTLIREMKMKTK